MIKGAIANILEHMLAVRETGLTDPVCPLAAHMGEAFNLAIHKLGQPVAANTSIAARPLGQDSRAVMRTTGTKIGGAGY